MKILRWLANNLKDILLKRKKKIKCKREHYSNELIDARTTVGQPRRRHINNIPNI